MGGDSDRWAAWTRSFRRRDWAGLPRDILTLIFRKVGGFDVLCSVQGVCRPWRRLALDPDFWRIIDMRGHPLNELFKIDMEKPTQIAVDRCGGPVEELYIDSFGTDNLLKYFAGRSTRLRRLVLIAAHHVSNDGLVEFVTRCPSLVELQITTCSFRNGAYRKVGLACPKLKCFRLNNVHYARPELQISDYMDDAANAIADSMPQLCELQLIGNLMTNKGLHAILEKCFQLESLDIRACFNVKVDAVMCGKLAKFKNLKLPRDSTPGFEYQKTVHVWRGAQIWAHQPFFDL